MTARVRNIVLAVAGAALLASGAYALGSQAGGGSASAHGAGGPAGAAVGYGGGFERHRFGGPAGAGLDALASKLDVSPDKLRTALQDVRGDLPRSNLEARLADALGDGRRRRVGVADLDQRVDGGVQQQDPSRRAALGLGAAWVLSCVGGQCAPEFSVQETSRGVIPLTVPARTLSPASPDTSVVLRYRKRYRAARRT